MLVAVPQCSINNLEASQWEERVRRPVEVAPSSRNWGYEGSILPLTWLEGTYLKFKPLSNDQQFDTCLNHSLRASSGPLQCNATGNRDMFLEIGISMGKGFAAAINSNFYRLLVVNTNFKF